ncbi:hypothetical protein [Mucilaginibacter ginsenosidivorax]|uniref:tRNA (Guanine-N1)-methyltransferase n=1 Tax=Mucilaginibacter ginsenosidivorax TaxID=862126 RepID=A0A5B8VVY6_9SPHI|nr:hypothetical protein [Mucilaginibacter ginsenosidivorax]QEC75757.1 hypothetical protein FSB76_07245 [Mucilaginibacter ginsenosidivorax]
MMNKHFIFRISVLMVVILGFTGVGFAQDTVKKAAAKPPAAKTAVVKPVVKYGVAAPAGTAKPAITPPKYNYQPRPTAADSALAKDKSLNGQYQYLLSKLYHYQQPLVSALWKNLQDTLKTERRNLKEAQAKLAAQTQDITGLKSDVATKSQTLSESNAKRDEINLVGISFTKATYNLMMWGLVIVFGLAAAIVIARSGAHSREAKYRIKLYNELDEEYKTYKAKANEKEKKLARELQTERNKLDELLGRG